MCFTFNSILSLFRRQAFSSPAGCACTHICTKQLRQKHDSTSAWYFWRCWIHLNVLILWKVFYIFEYIHIWWSLWMNASKVLISFRVNSINIEDIILSHLNKSPHANRCRGAAGGRAASDALQMRPSAVAQRARALAATNVRTRTRMSTETDRPGSWRCTAALTYRNNKKKIIVLIINFCLIAKNIH